MCFESIFVMQVRLELFRVLSKVMPQSENATKIVCLKCGCEMFTLARNQSQVVYPEASEKETGQVMIPSTGTRTHM